VSFATAGLTIGKASHLSSIEGGVNHGSYCLQVNHFNGGVLIKNHVKVKVMFFDVLGKVNFVPLLNII
jgi:hypothetical protein